MYQDLLDTAISTSIKAGEAVLEIYKQDDFNIEVKSDYTPITKADKVSHSIITNCLKDTNTPIISEEGTQISYAERKNLRQFWLIDPLDGTKEFIKGNGEFTINIALIVNKKATVGVIYAPVIGELFYGIVGQSAHKATVKNGIIENTQQLPIEINNDRLLVVASRSFKDSNTEKFISDISEKTDLVLVGSSLKLCMIAEGKADIYPRLVNINEWDIAAGVAIIKASGGIVLSIDIDKEIMFNNVDLSAPCFIAKNKKNRLWRHKQ